MTLNQIKALLKESEQTGRPIQVLGTDGWFDAMANGTMTFMLSDDCYRVAPPEPPKPREWWVRGSHAIEVEQPISSSNESDLRKMGYVLTREVL